MRHKSLCMSLLLLLFVSSSVGAAKRNDSAHIWLERMRAALEPSSSTQARATLETWDGFEVGTVIEMKVSRHTSPAEKRTLMELTQPDAAKGTVYEVVAGSEGSLEGWEYLPSVRRLRRMSGIHRTDLFMGTEFSYEALDFVGSMERVPGRVEWVREEGRSLVRVTSPPGLSSGKVVTLIEPMTALPVRIAFFEESGELIRVQEFGRVETIQGHRVPTVVVMRDVRSGSTSTLSLQDIQFDVAVPNQISQRDEVQRSQGHSPR
jgi:hypothetical protein